jgi:hypothetical protein
VLDRVREQIPFPRSRADRAGRTRRLLSSCGYRELALLMKCVRNTDAEFLHSRPGPAGRRSSHVRYAPKATVGHQNAIGRDGPKADIEYTITGGNYVVAIAGIITRSGPRLGPPARI